MALNFGRDLRTCTSGPFLSLIETIPIGSEVGSFFYEGWDSFSTPDLLFPVTPVRAPAELVEALNSPRLVQLEPHLKARTSDACLIRAREA